MQTTDSVTNWHRLTCWLRVAVPRDPTIGFHNGSAAVGGERVRWHGQIDEVRGADVARSPSWIWASYFTVASNDTALTYSVDAP